jgi:hypothetical protein
MNIVNRAFLFPSLLVLAAFFALPSLSYGQERGSRRKKPSTHTPSQRSQSPRKAADPKDVRDRLAARDLYTMLRYNRFNRAVEFIGVLKKEERLARVRLKYYELWPSPKDLAKIAKQVQRQPIAIQTILQEWTGLRGPRAKSTRSNQMKPAKKAKKATVGKKKKAKLY